MHRQSVLSTVRCHKERDPKDADTSEVAASMAAVALSNSDQSVAFMQALEEAGADPGATTLLPAALFKAPFDTAILSEDVPATPLMLSAAAGNIACMIYLLGLGQRCNPHVPMPLRPEPGGSGIPQRG